MEFLTFLLLSCVCAYLLDCLWKPHYIGIASPFRIPLIGHAISLARCSGPHKLLTAWSKKNGDIFSIQILNRKSVVLNGYENIHEALVTKGKDFAGRSKYFRSSFLAEEKDIVTQDYSPKWKKLTSFTHSLIRKYAERSNQMENITLSISDDLVSSLKSRSISGCVDPYDSIHLSVINLFAVMMTGNKFTMDDPVFHKILSIEDLSNEYGVSISKGVELDLFPWLRYFGNNSFKKLQQVNRERDEVYNSFKTMYHHYKDTESDSAEVQGIIFALMDELYKEKSKIGNCLDEETIKYIVLDFIIAGVRATVGSLYVFSMLMATKPDIQQKIYAEITSQINSKPEADRSDISSRDRTDMPYINACILELQRYASFLPLMFPHKTLTNVDISGVQIPQGTEIIMNTWDLHHDEKYWDSPWEFIPDRFINSETGQLVSAEHMDRKRLMTFGAGVRGCLGKNFALSSLFLFATNIVKNFSIEPSDDSDLPKHDPRTYDFGVALKPQRCLLKFVER